MPRFRTHLLLRAIFPLFFALPWIAQPNLWGQSGKLLPVDEARQDPSFLLFRTRLLQALQDRDQQFLLSILSPDVKSSFGGDDGISDFRSYWELDRPDSAVWITLQAVLSLGGSFEGGNHFVAPYTSSKFPDSLDAFEHGVILGDQVVARKRPEPTGEAVATLSFDIVSVVDWTPVGGEQDWIAVNLVGDGKAFVPRDQIRSPIDYRAFFEKKSDKWLLTIFVAGD